MLLARPASVLMCDEIRPCMEPLREYCPNHHRRDVVQCDHHLMVVALCAGDSTKLNAYVASKITELGFCVTDQVPL
jgi:hypothetical protein